PPIGQVSKRMVTKQQLRWSPPRRAPPAQVPLPHRPLVEQAQQAFSLLGRSIARPDATDVADARGWAAGTAPPHRPSPSSAVPTAHAVWDIVQDRPPVLAVPVGQP